MAAGDLSAIVYTSGTTGPSKGVMTPHLHNITQGLEVPRYYRVVQDLPRTPNDKVRKVELRQQGITGDTWDATAAGMLPNHHAV